MPKKRFKVQRQAGNNLDLSKDLWVAPQFSLKGRDGNRAWDHRHVGDPNSARFLELADIALGVHKRELRKHVAASGTAAHDTVKTEPYSPE
jgi:hypothetical protein